MANTHNLRMIYQAHKDLIKKLDTDCNVTSHLKYIISEDENIKPRAAGRISNITELITELEIRRTLRYMYTYIWKLNPLLIFIIMLFPLSINNFESK